MTKTEIIEMESRANNRGCCIKKIRGKNEEDADRKFYKFTDRFDVDVRLLTVRKVNKNKVVYKVYYC